MMRTNARASIVLMLLPALSAGTAVCQQLAFTSRAYVQSPVVISSVESSKDFGFDSVVLRNDGPESDSRGSLSDRASDRRGR